jgi:xanthine dehydrogenase YagR molybdenum-binding subunit
MAEKCKYDWPDAADRSLIGKSISRIDGPAKSSGQAKYSYDIKRPGMLYGKMYRSPYAHAKITSIDTSEAEKSAGVKALIVIQPVGTEIQWAGDEIVCLAAETESQAEDAIRKLKVEYDPLPHLVVDNDLDIAGSNLKPADQRKTGDPDQAFADSGAVISEGFYGVPVITHCCLETHGVAAEWTDDSHVTVWASTQNVSGIAGEIAEDKDVGIPAANIRIICQYIGGGFGSKFSPDRWGILTVRLAKAAKRPVKMMLERDMDLEVAGARPAAYAHVKVAVKKDGTITGWDSESWATGGLSSGNMPPIPYVIEPPNRRTSHKVLVTNIGPARAWRAPSHPQACVLTMCAFDDAAAKLNMDALDFFLLNTPLAGERGKMYHEELLKAADMMEWKKKWHPRGDKTPGIMKRGLGLSMHTWGGRGHTSKCQTTIHPDGSVVIALGSQDLGTGTRTVINIVAAETLGLPLDAVKVEIGDSLYPPSGASGGSTTVGGVSSSTRRSTTDARDQLFAAVAPSLGAKPEDLVARDGRIHLSSDASKGMTWKEACRKLGVKTIQVVGANPGPCALISSGVGGVLMADVSVDTETGLVKMNKLVAVQDCGLIIDMKTAESQVLGALIMGVTYSLFEEKVMDQQTGRMLNPNMEFYKLAGIGDIGKLEVHMMTGPGYDDRGVIGLGEPPVISPGAAISNAVANAIGVRVPTLPFTPGRVLAALEKGGMA